MGRRRGLPAVLVVLGLLAATGVALVVAAALSSTASVQEGVAAAEGRDAIAAALAAHAGPARAELREVEGRWRAVPRAGAAMATGPAPHHVGALLWDPSASRLLSLSVPTWTVSATSWKLRALGGAIAPFERRLGVELEIADELLDASGLLVDHEFGDGRRLLVWSE